MSKKTNSMIIGTGHYLPETILTNKDLEKTMDTTDEWITRMVGIKERHIIGDSGEANSDLGSKAAMRAIEDAGITAEDLDVIIYATVTPDMKFPSTAIFVQQKIGAVNAAVFDIAAACTGWIYGLILADSLIATGKYKNILVVGAEVLTSMVDWKDRGTAVLFGDGAGACIMGPSDGERGILGSYMKSDGRLADLLWAKGGGTLVEKTVEDAMHNDSEETKMCIRMEGNKVYKNAVRAMIESAESAMKDAEVTEEDIDILIPHQANLRIIDAIARRVNLPDEKVIRNLENVGNTSAASIPIALDQARKKGMAKEGENLLVAAFGGGFTWGGLVIKL